MYLILLLNILFTKTNIVDSQIISGFFFFFKQLMKLHFVAFVINVNVFNFYISGVHNIIFISLQFKLNFIII